AERYNLETIGDLKQVEDQITAGFTLEFNDRQDGYQGMKEVYDLNLGEVRTMDPGLRQGAIKDGSVDIIDAYATSGYMVDLNLKVLEDPENLFPPYQGAPLMRQETLDRYPEIKDALNQLGGKITGDKMRQMNYEVDYEDRSPEEVAREYLVSEGLIEE
ncbi:MAG: glycine betaine ABC transporter substrate-binding protein, partial [Halobacillus sp.]